MMIEAALFDEIILQNQNKIAHLMFSTWLMNTSDNRGLHIKLNLYFYLYLYLSRYQSRNSMQSSNLCYKCQEYFSSQNLLVNLNCSHKICNNCAHQQQKQSLSPHRNRIFCSICKGYTFVILPLFAHTQETVKGECQLQVEIASAKIHQRQSKMSGNVFIRFLKRKDVQDETICILVDESILSLQKLRECKKQKLKQAGLKLSQISKLKRL